MPRSKATQAKDYIQNYASNIVSKIITCFDDYFANIYEQKELHSNKPSEKEIRSFLMCTWLSVVVSGQILLQTVI